MSELEKAADKLEAIMSQRKCMEAFTHSGKGELFILKYLASKGSPALPSEISEALHSSTSRISAALGTLQKKGQITRVVDVTNRRNILVTITDAGRQRIEAFIRHMRIHLIAVLAEMGEGDAKEFVRLMGRFSEIAERMMIEMSLHGNRFPGE
jgi:DNA-binding MarR family transcriptional regulator